MEDHMDVTIEELEKKKVKLSNIFNVVFGQI